MDHLRQESKSKRKPRKKSVLPLLCLVQPLESALLTRPSCVHVQPPKKLHRSINTRIGSYANPDRLIALAAPRRSSSLSFCSYCCCCLFLRRNALAFCPGVEPGSLVICHRVPIVATLCCHTSQMTSSVWIRRWCQADASRWQTGKEQTDTHLG